MPRCKGKKRADKEYRLLYHLSRTGIIPKTDLSLCRGNLDDRYAQELIAKNIKQGRIESVRYRKSRHCFITNSGIEFFREQERDVYNRSDLLDEYQDFLQNNPQNPLVKEALALQAKRNQINSERNKFLVSNPSAEWRKRNLMDPNNATERIPSNSIDSDPPVLNTKTSASTGISSRENGRAASEAQEEPENILLWKPGEREPTKPMNSQKRIKLERLADGSYSDKLKAEVRHGGANNLLYSTGVLVYEEDKPDYVCYLCLPLLRCNSPLSQPRPAL